MGFTPGLTADEKETMGNATVESIRVIPGKARISRHHARRLTLRLAMLVLAGYSLLGATCGSSRSARLVATVASPVYVTSAPGDPRVFILERAGRIRVIDANGTLLTTPFLDIHSRVTTVGEGGLLGLAFSPQYATDGECYVCYANLAGTSVLSRFLVDPGDPNLANPISEFVLLTAQPSEIYHKGGTIAFSPSDGYLYLGLGDGGNSEMARDPASLLGKILRLDVVSGGPTSAYSIPPTNPFVGPGGVRDEVWASGLRNPFRFSFDRDNGDLWIADVGSNLREEIDYEAAGDPGGRDYGWPSQEASLCNLPSSSFPCDDPANPARFTFPIYEYTHAEGCAISGGVVYRGPSVFLKGKYLFSDFCSQRIWSLVGGQRADLTPSLFPDPTKISGVTAIGEDAVGNAYVVTMLKSSVYLIK